MTAHITHIALDRIAESPTQPRSVYAGIEALAESINQQGLLQPIVVRPIVQHDIIQRAAGDQAPDYELVCGHRRYRACQSLGLETIAAVVRPLSDLDVLVSQIAENLQRDDVSPLDEARAMQQLREQHGKTKKEIAKLLGASERHVSARLQLLRLTGRARDALISGDIGGELGVLIAAYPHVVHDIALDAVLHTDETTGERRALSLRRAREVLRGQQLVHDIMSAPFDILDLHLVTDAGACTTCPHRSAALSDEVREALGDDACTWSTCWDAKVRSHQIIQAQQAAEAAEEAAALAPAILSPAVAPALPLFGGEGGSVATGQDRRDEEPSEVVTVTIGDSPDAIAALADQIIAAMLARTVRPDAVELGMVTVAMIGLADTHDAYTLDTRPAWRARAADVDDIAAGHDVARLTPLLLATALRVLATSSMTSYVGMGRPDRLISTLQHLARKYLPAPTPTAPPAEGEGVKASAGQAGESEDHEAPSADAEEAETSAAVPAARADEGDGHPAAAQPDPVALSTAPAVDRFEAARAAGHAAGLADLRRGSAAYLAAMTAARVMVDSQEECDWDAGYRAGSDELAQRCADAERRGRVIAQQGGAGRYAAGLLELTGSAVEAGPIAAAYKRGYTTGQRSAPPIKYRHPETGQTWSGRGLAPRWIVEARDQGRDLSDFATGA